MLIMEYKGKDKVDIYYGNFRVQGNQIKKLAAQGGAEVFSYKVRKFEQFGANPMESMLQVLCLDFAVFYNEDLVYAKGKGESGVDVTIFFFFCARQIFCKVTCIGTLNFSVRLFV
jgi:hypothetical protein